MILRIGLIFILSLVLSSCSNQSPSEPVIVDPQVTTSEVQTTSREAVFTYGENSQAKNISLSFSAEPVQINEGYIRLVGIIAGNNPLACIEIGGKGRVVGLGELVEQYVVSKISKKEVLLCLKK
ncbi:MAG: hypothetical protein HQ564_09260 [Candidatus Saganbacteria bacterium]|nr:hypothetical protein [Candidatus Saganbacteria bacterium]